jgi:ankyrin repeat protein
MSISQQTEQPDVEEIRTFVIAGHGNLEKVKQMLAARPELLNIAHEWGPGDTETALQGAAHVGNAPIAEYLLSQGAPLDICTAAMLGRRANVEAFLAQDSASIHAKGAHGIPLLSHVALSGDVGLAAMLHQRGATTGSTLALSLAVSKGHVEMVRWLLENGSPDLAWKNFQGKTALTTAVENGNENIAALLRMHGATE